MLRIFLALIPISLVLDFAWIGGICSKFYKRELGPLLRMRGDALAPLWPAALLVYILIPLGVTYFVAGNFTAKTRLGDAAFAGGLFGLVLYGVYDLTNYSLLSRWPLSVTLVDLCWGMLFCSLQAIAALLIWRRI